VYNSKRGNSSISPLAVSLLVVLMITGISITNANALDLPNLDEVNDLGQSVE
jgi:hypothetical protein